MSNRSENSSAFVKTMRRLSNLLFYKVILIILGLPLHIILFGFYMKQRQKLEGNASSIEGQQLSFEIKQYKEQIIKEKRYFNEAIHEAEIEKEATALARKKLQEESHDEAEQEGHGHQRYFDYVASKLSSPKFVLWTFIPGILLYIFVWLYSNSLRRYIVDRVVLSVFVIIGVSILVFTILFFSPMDPAANILGESATPEQIETFNHQHGLDKPYTVQLADSVKGIFTFDLGKSFTGKEEISTSIANRFPITLKIAVFSLLLAIVIAIPVGMISAARMNSFWDYGFMFLALIGLSIPSFWQGLIMILEFSIKLHWLPATYTPGEYVSLIMPVIVLGTGLTASVARMTRSSILEVIHEDYMITAKAKGLRSVNIFFNHALRNAMIPIITVIGLQFGAMIGGAAVTEKVFNIRGLGSYIVDKQFIPDIPAIMGGVVYIAITVCVVNLIIDVLYAFLNPRVRSQMNKS